MNRRLKLKDVFNDPLTTGIFDSLQALDVPWKTLGIDSSLDLFFITNYGQRNISPLTNTCLDENGKLTVAKQTLLATALFNLYGTNWAKEYAILSLQYDPIENYSMEEKHTGNDTKLETPTNWKDTETKTPTDWVSTETQTPTDWKSTETKTPTDWVSSETQTPTDWVSTETQSPDQWKKTTESLKANNDIDASSGLYAFNSASAVPISESDTQTDAKTTEEQTGTFEKTVEQTGTFTKDISQTGTFQTETEQTGTFKNETQQTGTFKTEHERTGTYEDKTTYNSTLKRTGNIGTVTSQMMIGEEIDLWKWNYFCDVVFPDIAKALTISLY